MLSKKKLSPYFLLALLVLLAWASFSILAVFMDYILGGLFVGYITYPLYKRLLGKVRYAGTSAFLMTVGVLVLVVVPLAWMSIELVTEMRTIIRSLDPDQLQAQIDSLLAALFGFFGYQAPQGDRNWLVELVAPSISGAINQFASRLLGVVAEGTVGVFVLVYILYYTYADGEKLLQKIRELLPLQEAHRDLLFHEISSVVKGVMFGHVLTSIFQTVLAAAGFIFFGVPNVVFWSLLVFILSLLPLIGAPLVWVPWGLVMILEGDTVRGIGFLIYSAIMVSSLDNFVRPKLIGDHAHVHPTIVLLGVLGGLAVFGVTGFFLGPLILSIFVTVLDVFRKEFADGDEVGA